MPTITGTSNRAIMDRVLAVLRADEQVLAALRNRPAKVLDSPLREVSVEDGPAITVYVSKITARPAMQARHAPHFATSHEILIGYHTRANTDALLSAAVNLIDHICAVLHCDLTLGRLHNGWDGWDRDVLYPTEAKTISCVGELRMRAKGYIQFGPVS